MSNSYITSLEYLRKQREAEERAGYIRRKIEESKDHDRHTCNCDGCKYWWEVVITIIQGEVFEVVPDIKTVILQKGIDLYIRDFIIKLQRTRQPLWIAYASNKGMVYKQL